MTRPGTVINVLDATPPRSAPVGIDAWFITGMFPQGPLESTLVRGMTELEAMFGERNGANPVAYDSAEAFFREGGSRLYVSRVVGPAPLAASVTIDTSVKVSAKTPGTYGNALKVAVLAGGVGTERILVLQDAAGNELERTLSADKPGLIAQSAGLEKMNIVSGGATALPTVAAAVALTGGTGDEANAVETNWTAALALHSGDFGPGQVSAPGRTTIEAHNALRNHAEANNRIALLDAPALADKATLIAAADANRQAGNESSRFAAIFAPWAVIPGVAPNTTRTVPYSALQAGMMARSSGNPNTAVAGVAGRSRFAIDLTLPPFTDQDREDLNNEGVDIARNMFDGIRTYGYRSLADPVEYSQWVQLSAVRLFMEIKAKCAEVLERHMFSQMDGEGIEFGSLAGDLTAAIGPYWQPMRALYGNTSPEAFQVDTGTAVNTPTTIANGELRARVSLRVSPFAELVVLDLVNQRITEAL
jgi:phage tail sheath protein FI